MNDLATTQNMYIDFPHVQFGEQGLIFEGRISYEEWEYVCKQVQYVARRNPAYIADVLLYGEKYHNDRWEQMYDPELWGLSHQTIDNYRSIFRRVPPEVRRLDALSLGHHDAVRALPVERQRYWLERAAEEGWRRADLRAAVAEELRTGKTGRHQEIEGRVITSELLPPAVESVVLPSPDEAFEVLERWIEESQSPEQRAQRIQSIRVHLPVEEVEDIHDQPEPEGEWIPGGVVFSDEDINELAELLNDIVACAERVQEETRRPSPDYAVIYDAIEPVQDKAERTLELLYSKGRRV